MYIHNAFSYMTRDIAILYQYFTKRTMSVCELEVRSMIDVDMFPRVSFLSHEMILMTPMC